jgi:A nuclease family of the HNH/ENDO VII superfamily with conserved AHH
MSKEHQFYEEKYYLHIRASGTDGGACFSKHESKYDEHNSCSYRWQGVVKARERKDIYNIEKHPNWHLDNFSKPESWKNVAFAQSTINKMKPKLYKQIFDKAGNPLTNKGKVIVGTPNFINGQAPYRNQVHHLIANGLFCDELSKTVNTVPEKAMAVFYLVIKGLMKEKYNINYKDNMIILPCEPSVAKKIGLPTHLGSHPTYDSYIKGRIQSSLRPYKKIALQLAKNVEEHDTSDPKKLKDDLLKISSIMYNSIIDFGQSNIKNKGAFRINDLPDAVFKNIKKLAL